MEGSVASSNPQHYQPLSHALNPVFTAVRPHSPYGHYGTDVRDGGASSHAHIDRDEEEEEEEEEEADGALNMSSGASNGGGDGHLSSSLGRRRPGRPKGSKNKKPRFDMSTPATPAKPPFSPQPFFGFPQAPPPPAVPVQPPPAAPPVVVPPIAGDPNTQQFFDFQWRVLTLCSEFYNAADELIRGAPPHVVSQCFSLPGNHVDPLNVLHEARRACDQLMANPSQNVLKASSLISSYPPETPAKTPSVTATPTTSPPSGVISNPASFVMSLNPPSTPAPSSSSYNTISPPPRYPTTSYYAYATTTNHSSSSHPYLQQSQVMKPVSLTTPAAAGNQGAWSEEETEKLQKLAEESRGQSNPDTREIDWDWVCNNWGSSRTRHQILIKATNVGLKESSTRGVKKKRESEPTPAAEAHGNASISPPVPPPPSAPPSTGPSNMSAAPPDRPASTSLPPHHSPAMSHAHPPPSASTTGPAAAMMGNWPMPHVAANTPSPVISSSTQPTVGRTPYYRTNDRHAVGK